MSDRWVIRAVVVILGALAAVGLLGCLVLAAMGKPVPGEAVAISATSAGAVGAILSRTSSTPKGEGE